MQALRAIGYPVDDMDATTRAFRLRFRARDDGGALDDEDRRILHALQRGWTIAPREPVRAR